MEALFSKRQQVIHLSRELGQLLLQSDEQSIEQKALMATYRRELEWLHNVVFEKKQPTYPKFIG